MVSPRWGWCWCGDGVRAALASAVQPVAAGLADGLAAAGVLVVGGHVPDRLVESNRIVFHSHSFQFDINCGGIGDGLQVRPLAFEVAEERLDPGLIGRSVRAAVVLGDGHHAP